MFVYPAIKPFKELWRVEGRARSGRLKSVRAEAAIKTVRSGFAEIRSGNKIVPRKLNISTQSSRASSGTIYTWARTSAQRGASLVLLWRKFEGQEQSVSSSRMPRTGTVTSSSRTRKFSPSSSSITTSTTRFMPKVPLGAFCGCMRPSPFLRHGLVGGVPSGGDTSFLRDRCENCCPSVSGRCATRSLETS